MLQKWKRIRFDKVDCRLFLSEEKQNLLLHAHTGLRNADLLHLLQVEVPDRRSSAEPIMVTLVGGVESFYGPLVGSVVFVLLKEIVVRFTQEWLLVFGIIQLGLLIGFRGGMVGFIQNLFSKQNATEKIVLHADAGGKAVQDIRR